MRRPHDASTLSVAAADIARSTIFAASFGDRLRSVVAYGPHVEGDSAAPLTCLALVSQPDARRPRGVRRTRARWAAIADRHAARPSRDEFRRSLDAFPLEYGEIIRAHQRVFGDDPFTDVAIAPGRSAPRLRDAGQEPSGSPARRLHRVRRRPGAVAELVAASAPAFTALLRNVARLNGVLTSDRAEPTRLGARRGRIPEQLVGDSFRSSIRPASPQSIRLACSPSTSPPSNSSRSGRHLAWLATRRSERSWPRCAAASVLLAALGARAQPHAAELTRPVNDFANVIDPDSAAQMESLIRALQEATRRRRRRRDVDTLERYDDIKRIRRADVREPRPAASVRSGKDNGLLVLAGGEGSAGQGRSRLRPGAVHHRRLRRRDQPPGDGAAVPQRRVRRRAAWRA